MIPTTFEVRKEKLEEKLKRVGQMLEETMPEGWEFIFLISKLEDGVIFYTSSINEADMIATMREFIQQAESN